MMTWRSKEWIGKIWKERHYMKIKEKNRNPPTGYEDKRPNKRSTSSGGGGGGAGGSGRRGAP